MMQYPHLETVKKWEELECGLCHRIDLETSGALLIAKTARARDLIWDQFRRRYVHKEYILLCHGRIKETEGMIKTRLMTTDYGPKIKGKIRSHFTTVVAHGGEVAVTEYSVCKVFKRKAWSEIRKVCVHSLSAARHLHLFMQIIKNRSTSTRLPEINGKESEDEEFTLCSCRIITGRTHQIRVHMRHIGHPLVGDSKYLEPISKCAEDRVWCQRMFLHAAALEFVDPDTNVFTEVICPLAQELIEAIDSALELVEDLVDTSAYGI